MSTAPPTPAAPPATGKGPPNEVRIIAHSSLFYWWPVWFFGLVFALWTYVDNNRLAVIPSESTLVVSKAIDGREILTIRVDGKADRLLTNVESEKTKDELGNDVYKPSIRVSPRAWMGPLFTMIMLLVIIITNVPLRGLWSLIVIIGTVVVALILSLMDKWDDLLKALGNLHIYTNMAGYLAISVVLFVGWCLAVFLFDKRTYIVFTPGQVRVCEEIGGRERVYDTTGMSVEKHRDDWFRHIILGWGTGDLTVRTAGADRHEIVMPNVAFIGFKIDAVEQMLRSRQTKS